MPSVGETVVQRAEPRAEPRAESVAEPRAAQTDVSLADKMVP